MASLKARLRPRIFTGFLIASAIVGFTKMAFLVFVIISGNPAINQNLYY